jgi:glycosyltransferase involved in cell wall biosynthesis
MPICYASSGTFSSETEDELQRGKMLQGTVTVVIPVYNGQRFIRRAVDSILKQTYPVTQIIVVDDGSKDATCSIVESEYSDQVILLRQQNGGPAKARNAGLRIAIGEFIAFLDADDWWEPEKISTQVKVLREHPAAVGNYTGLRVMSDEGAHLIDLKPVDHTTLWPTLRWCNPGVPPSSVLLRRAVLEELGGGFNERQLGSEDWNLWFRLITKGPFCVCPEPLTDYRSSAGGLSGDANHMYNDFMKMLDDTLLGDMTGLQRSIWRRRIISYQAFKACLTARAAGDKKTEREYMKKSLLQWPSPFWASERFRFFAVTLLRT